MKRRPGGVSLDDPRFVDTSRNFLSDSTPRAVREIRVIFTVHGVVRLRQGFGESDMDQLQKFWAEVHRLECAITKIPGVTSAVCFDNFFDD